MDLNRRLPRIDTGRFSMIPTSEVPRSTFVTSHSVKTTFNAADLVPIHVEEVLPGDVHQGEITIFARLANLIFPLMDNVFLETFAFFCPNRLVWTNWVKLMGQRDNPSDSISYLVPQNVSPAGGWTINSIYDQMGIPVSGQVAAGETISVNALPFRMYRLIWNEWFRDENLQNSVSVPTGDGPDAGAYSLLQRNKKHDYFTSCLPWPLKGGVDVTLPIGGIAPVRGISLNSAQGVNAGTPASNYEWNGTAAAGWTGYVAGNLLNFRTLSGSAGTGGPYIYADLNNLTGATINALRLSVMTQRFLEKDARSGTRYTELLRAHFGVQPEDTRLQRPEYIGGGRTTVQTQAIPQTSATGLTGGTSPLGSLGAQATLSDQHSYTYYAKEHGFIIVLANVSLELTYQQGLHKMWTRQTRYDYYHPIFANLGEQAVLRQELYCTGNDASDQTVFGYTGRWDEYRYYPSRISGMFRSTTTGNIDEWHLGEQFLTAPALDSAFITQTRTPLTRALAAGSAADAMQILFDSVWRIKRTRPMPMWSIPGGLERF